MRQDSIRDFSAEERAIYETIARGDGLKAREIAARLGLNRTDISRLLVSSALMREQMTARNEKRRLGLRLHFGRPELSGDNAVGVALIGMKKWMKEQENGGHPGW